MITISNSQGEELGRSEHLGAKAIRRWYQSAIRAGVANGEEVVITIEYGETVESFTVKQES